MEPIFIPLRCPCGHAFEVSAGAREAEADCPACGRKIPVPAAEAPSSEPSLLPEKPSSESPAPGPSPTVPQGGPAKTQIPGCPPQEGALGKVAIEKGWITSAQLEEAVKLQAEAKGRGESLRLGEALVRLEVLTPDQVRQALLTQDKVTMRCPSCRKTFNVKGYKPGTRPLCKGCNVPLVLATSPTALHVSDTSAGVQRTPAGTPADPALADLIHGYKIERCVGSGGMGDVYLARQTSLDRLVAVKLLPPELAKNQTFVQRFLTEARSAARLTQENIVAAVDAGESQGRYYFVMEYVEGETLQQIIRREGALPERRVLEIGRQIALGLRHAHKHDLIHRDIKPANIMIAVDGTAKICDFGLAKQIDDVDVGLTQPGMVHSSPAYASPEQCRGRRDIDHRSDMYSLGVTLFEAITGKRPFGSESTGELFIQHATDQPPSPQSINPSVSSDVNRLVLRLLRKAPEGRFIDYDALLEAMDQIGKPAATAPPSASTAAAPDGAVPLYRRPLFVKLAIGGAAALVGIVLLSVFIGGDPEAAPAKTDADAKRVLAALRDREKEAAKRPSELPKLRQEWNVRIKEFQGTPYYPAFAAGLREFEKRLNSRATSEAGRRLKEANALVEAGKEGDALVALRGYPAAYAETDGARQIARRITETEKLLGESFRTGADEVASLVSSGRLDDARRGLESLRTRLTITGPQGPEIVKPAFAERLAGLARAIEEKQALAKAPGSKKADPPPSPSGTAKPGMRRQLDHSLYVMNLAGIAAVYCELNGKPLQAVQLRRSMTEVKARLDRLVAALKNAGQDPFVDDFLLPNDRLTWFENQNLNDIGRPKAAALLGTFVAQVKGGSRARAVRVRGSETKEFVIRFDERPAELLTIIQVAGLIPGQTLSAAAPAAKVAKAPERKPPAGALPKPKAPPAGAEAGKAPRKPAPPSPNPAAVAPPAGGKKKHAEPDAETQKEAEAVVREIFQEDYSRRSPDQMKAFAEKLLQRAIETEGEVAVCYILFREARDLAAKAGDATLALQAVDEMAASYEVDVLAMKISTLARASSSARTPDAVRSVARGYLDVVAGALLRDDYDAAATAAAKGASVARITKDRFLINTSQKLRKEVSYLRSEYRKVRKWIDKPGSGGEEAVGVFFCFVKGDWDRGLPLLARARDESLKALAEKDLADPSEGREQVEVGDGWWKLADKERNSWKKKNLLARVRHWYERALPSQTGIVRLRLDKRLEDMEAAASAPRTGGAMVKGIEYAYYEGFWTRVPDFDALKPVKTGTVAIFDIGGRLRREGIGFKFTGFIKISKPGIYTFYTTTDDGSKLHIGKTEVVNNDGPHPAREMSGKITLKAGYHPITVTFFQGAQGMFFAVAWEGPGFSKQSIRSSVLYRLK